MMDKGIWRIVVILAVLVTIGSCAAMTVSAGLGILPDYPEIKEPQHNIEGIGHNSTQIHSTAILYNPNIFPIKFKGVEYSIFLNDILIGSGHSEDNVLILPRSEKKLAFESEVYQKQILKWLKERIKTRKNTTVNIKGDVTFDLGILDYKHPINISITESEIWKKHFNNSFSFAYPVTDLTGDKISEMIIDVWNFEDGYISGEVRVVDGEDGSLLWNRSLGAGIPVAYPATDLNGDNVTDFIVNLWDIDRNWATQILALNGVNGSELWKWEDEDGLAAAYPCTDFNGDKITEIVVNSYSFIEEERSTPAATYAQHDDSEIQAERVKGVNSASRVSNSNVSFGFEVSTSEKTRLTRGIEDTEYRNNVPNIRNLIPGSPNQIDSVSREENKFNLTTMRSLGDVFFTDGYADFGIDMNGDGKYNYLAIDVGVNVKKAGKYSIEGSLYDSSSGDYIEGTSTDRILDVGMQNVTLRFNGYPIYRHGTSGRFDLEDLEVYDKDWNMLGHRDYAYTTSYYSFTAFDVPPADITGSYSNYGIDTDGDGKYNCLAIDVWVNTKEAGIYEVYGRLEDSGGQSITSDRAGAYLSKGLQKITLKFSGYDIYKKGVNGPFSLDYVDLDDEEGNREVDHRHNAYTTSFYYYMDFDKPPADLTGSYSECGIDADGDGKYDYLTIDVWVSVKEVGYYNLQGWLDDCHGYGINYDWNGTYLKVGLQKLTLEFNGYEIYRYGASGFFSLGHVKLLDDDWNAVDDKWDVYSTSYFAYTDFDKPPIDLTGAYADYGVDTDGNGKYDYFVVEVGVNVKEAGTYHVSGNVYDNENEYITGDWDETELSTGLQKLTLKFEGCEIYRNGVDGPFLLRYVALSDEWNRADYKYDSYVTSYYNHTKFDRKFTGNFDDYGIDTDEDGLYDYLEVEAEIKVTKAGEYRLSGSLKYPALGEDYPWAEIDTDWNRTYLEAGIHNITLQFDGLKIYNSKYSGSFRVCLSLYETIRRDEREYFTREIDEEEYFTTSYDYTDFQKPPAEFAPGFNDYGLDTDSNSLYDYLVIEKETKVGEAGNYRLSGSLESPSGERIDYDSNSTYLDVGLQSVKLMFYGPMIYKSEESGNFDVDMDLYDVDNDRILDPTTNTTSYYSYTDFERPPAEFTGNLFDYGLDIGEDGLYNYLVVESGINVTKAGEYRLSGDLRYYDKESDYWLDYAMNSTHLEAGITNITLKFHGWRIYNSEYNGSFKVELQLYDTEAKIDVAEYLTSYYNYTEFNPSPPIKIPVTEIYVFDGSNGAQLWNISIRNCLAAAYPISDIDGDNVSELLINKWIMGEYGVSFSKIEIVKGTDASELWNKSFADCFAVAYPVTDLNGDNVTELVVDAWRLDRPEPITEIFVIDGNEGSFLWNRSVSVGYLAAAYPVTDFTGDNITEFAINAFHLENYSTIIEIADGVDGTSLWSKAINNSLSAIYPASDLTKDGTSELIINSWLFSNGILSESEVFIVNGLDGAILWNFSANGMAATYPATDLTNNNVSEIIINVWGPELESTKIVIFEGLTHTKLFSKTMNNSLAAAYPVSDLTGDNISEIAVNELNFKKEATNITIVSITPSAIPIDSGEETYTCILGRCNFQEEP